MAAIKPSVPKGTRDFSPAEMVKRNFIFDTIKSVFRKYGYQQIETPSMENSSTLMGKYGDEGDKLIFKVLDSGDFLEKSKSIQEFENTLLDIIEKNINQRKEYKEVLKVKLSKGLSDETLNIISNLENEISN